MNRLLAVVFGFAALGVQASHLSQADVDKLMEACEEQREAKLGPERVILVERCMREEDLGQDACTKKYENYGERETGAIRKLGKYYDIPVCEEAWSARKHYKLNPGR